MGSEVSPNLIFLNFEKKILIATVPLVGLPSHCSLASCELTLKHVFILRGLHL